MEITLETLQSTADKEGLLAEILAKGYADSIFLAKLLFPTAFRSEMSSMHKKYFDFIDHCECPKKGVIAPRGWGKTTINEFIAKKKTLYQDKRFIGYLTSSGDVAITVSDSIKTDLVSNPLITKIFGDVSASKVEGVSEKWAEKSWVANGYTMVLPRGYGQQVNGLKWLVYRPDLWLIDDLEDRVEVRNAEQRKKLRTWFYGVLLYTFSQYEEDAKECEIIYTDTIKHPDAFMCHLMDDPDWEILNLPVCDEKYHTLAPGFKSQEVLDKEIASHRRNGTMDVFAMEMMGQAQSKETKEFKPSWIKYYSENDEEFVKNIKPHLINILLWDPSKTMRVTSADTGLVVWGIDLIRNAFYVRLAVGEKLTVGEQHDRVISLAEWFKIQVLGIELNSLEDHLLYPFINECNRRKKFWIPPLIQDLKPRAGKGELKGEEGGKEGRISLLYPYYEKGLVYHEKVAANTLEVQLLGSRLRDVVDAAAYLPQVLMSGLKFMAPEDTEEDPYLIEQEYLQLENEPTFERAIF